jgi:Ca2+/Na+ antiporter
LNPGNLTDRFKLVSFLYDDIPLIKKGMLLIRNYLYYWTPNFLIVQGDPEIRHVTEYGGIIFSTTMFLFIVAIFYFIKKKDFNKYHIFLALSLLSSPLAATLTLSGTPHSLRSFLLGYFILIFSSYGFYLISNIKEQQKKSVLQYAIIMFLVFEILGYQLNYFVFYPPKSVRAMGSYNFRDSLQLAIDQNPDEVVFLNNPRITYTNFEFYSKIVDNPEHIPIILKREPIAKEGTCILFHKWDIHEVDDIALSYIQYDVNMRFNLLQRLFDVKKPENIIKVRCYFGS